MKKVLLVITDALATRVVQPALRTGGQPSDPLAEAVIGGKDWSGGMRLRYCGP